MGFYLRKSIRVGPFRFNLSKSGIGISAGVRGFRVGSGPRGNYIQMGRGGVYYRATLPAARTRSTAHPVAELPDPVASTDPLQAIETGEVAEMRDSSSADLLDEFDRKYKAISAAPIVGGTFALGIIAAVAESPPAWLTITLIAVAIAATLFSLRRDALAKTVVLFYDLDADTEKNYELLHSAFRDLAACGRVWRFEASGTISDPKRHGGATSSVKRAGISISNGAPQFVKTNVAVPILPNGNQKLYFFPDRILVFDARGVGAVQYSDLRIQRTPSRFAEEDGVPSDATVVDQTWRYVNKKGGPDKRFKDNRQVPIALYEEIHLSSASGLNEIIQVSRVDAGRAFEAEIARRAVPKISPPISASES